MGSNLALELPRGAFCVVVRADSESGDGRGCSGGSEGTPRRLRESSEGFRWGSEAVARGSLQL
eukprot:5586664-Alexandrium_andersonii.AAC.1